MPGDPGATVVTNARAYYSTRAAAGATGTRHSPLPLGVAPRPLLGGSFLHNPGVLRRGKAEVCLMNVEFISVIPGCALLAQARNPYSLQGLMVWTAPYGITVPE
jgi:hypothetical protein